MDKIKIMFIFGTLNGGGAERQFGWLLQGIDKQRFETIVVSIGSDLFEFEEHIAKYPSLNSLDEEGKYFELTKFYLSRKLNNVCKIFHIRRQGLFNVILLLSKLNFRQKPNIIFFVSPLAAIFGFLPSLIYRNARTIFGMRGNGTLLSYKKNIFNYFHYFTQFNIDYYIGNSKALIKNAEKNGISKKKTKVIYNGIPIYYKKKNPTNTLILKSEIKIGFIARFHPDKDHFMFINAIKLISTDRNYSIHLYGKGELEDSLKKHVKKLELDDKIVFEGWVSEVSEILKTLDIVCLTSRYEGLNNSICEAQMHGIPVITTNCTGSNEIVEDGITGYVVPVGDAASFAERLKRLIEDDNCRAMFSQEAHKRTRAKFSIEKMIQCYETFFTEIVV